MSARGGLDVWVIYDHPEDYPEHFVVRPQTIERGKIAFGLPILTASLEAARGYVPEGLVCLARCPEDVPAIVETWI